MLFSVQKKEESIFLIHCEGTKETQKKIYLYEAGDSNSENEFIVSSTDEVIEVDLKGNVENPCFIIEVNEKKTRVSVRTLSIEGMNNFRDMGGYETADGKTVRWKKLFRSDQIYNATVDGINSLKKLGIRAIIDYRSDNERSKYPNKELGDGVETFLFDPDAHTAELAAQFTSSKYDEDLNLVEKIIEQKEKGLLVNQYDIVMEQYHNFVNKTESKKAFSNMIKVAANPSYSILVQHCRGGKDRTGFGTLLLLGILGVDKEQIIYDYMLTHDNRKRRNEYKMNIYRKFTDDKIVLDYLYSLIDSRPEFIEASYNAILEKYNNIEEYAKMELDITHSEIEKIRELYLE